MSQDTTARRADSNAYDVELTPACRRVLNVLAAVGVPVLRDGEPRGRRPGRVLRKAFSPA